MSEHGEYSNPNPAKRLNQFVSSEHERMAAVDAFLTEALSVIENVDVCNQYLIEFGRSDLAITSPAKMMDIETPLEILERGNNFAPNFQVTTSEAELDRLAAGVPTPESQRFSHARKPAYARMLILFPDFTRKFTLDFSIQGHSDLPDRYRAELFAAYQVMSRLVDQSDSQVMRDSQTDNWYLCR